MKRSALAGVVAFMVILTSLLIIDDITNTSEESIITEKVELNSKNSNTDLATLDEDE